MKKYRAILFDLDGTLLPMDMDKFMKAYFAELCASLSRYKVPTEKLVSSVWAGTAAMVKNDGTCSNEKRFWETFLAATDIQSDSIYAETEYFYSHEFNRARAATGENLLAREAVEAAGRDGRTVVLATNPLFPRTAQLTRLSWLGLGEGDFELITSYESDRFSKPNPEYYRDICRRLSLEPGQCLMIGNDVGEDMLASRDAGMDGYLVTDNLIPADREWDGPRGSFADMLAMLKSL